MVKITVERVRRMFPVVNRLVYFNNAGTGPLPSTTVKAMQGFLRQSAENGCVPYAEAEQVVEETRVLAGRVMRGKPDEIAFVKNTTSGIIIAIGSIPWEPEDNLIMMKDGFPANTYPYHLLLPEIEKRFVTATELSQGPETVFRLVDKKTKAVALDWVHFLSGTRFDVQEIGRFCQRHRIFFILDAIQGLGVINEDFSQIGADFVVAGGGKWLLSPQGVGLLYVNLKHLPRLKPYNLGWLSAHWVDFNDCFTPRPLKKNARRFEEGTKNYVGIYGLRASLKLLLDFGLQEIEERVLSLAGMLLSELSGAGFEVLTPRERNKRAGIVTCRHPERDMVEVQRKMEQSGYCCAVRQNWLRISPHFYNTEDEIARFIKQLRGITG